MKRGSRSDEAVGTTMYEDELFKINFLQIKAHNCFPLARIMQIQTLTAGQRNSVELPTISVLILILVEFY